MREAVFHIWENTASLIFIDFSYSYVIVLALHQ